VLAFTCAQWHHRDLQGLPEWPIIWLVSDTLALAQGLVESMTDEHGEEK